MTTLGGSTPFMEHLNELKDDVQASQAPVAKPLPDPKRGREYTFEFSYEDPRGERWIGTFTNKILSIAERIQVGTVRARMQSGVPPESFTPATFELIYAMSWMQTSLVKKPKWAEDIASVLDEELLLNLMQEVHSHEVTFRQRAQPAAASQGQSS